MQEIIKTIQPSGVWKIQWPTQKLIFTWWEITSIPGFPKRNQIEKGQFGKNASKNGGLDSASFFGFKWFQYVAITCGFCGWVCPMQPHDHLYLLDICQQNECESKKCFMTNDRQCNVFVFLPKLANIPLSSCVPISWQTGTPQVLCAKLIKFAGHPAPHEHQPNGLP